MKNVFSLVAFTAGAFCLAVLLSTLPSEGALLESGNPAATAALRAPDHVHGCRLHGPLLADSRGGSDVLSRLRGV